MTRFTRRQVLASVGLGGIVSAGLLRRQAASGPQWTRYTYAQTPSDERVLVAWYETYNGEVEEHQRGSTQVNASTVLDPQRDPSYVVDSAGPVVSIEDVVPGDAGRLVVGIALESRPDGSNPLAIDLHVALRAESEGGQTEPERRSGSNPPGGGLADALDVVVWHDGGLLCDGVLSGADTEIARGSLRWVSEALADGYRLCTPCFPIGTGHRCLGISWSLPAGIGNTVQTDSVTFDLTAEIHDRAEEASA